MDGDVTVKTNDAGTTSVAIYTCKAGATLNGVTLRTCQTDGTWTDNKPACSKLIGTNPFNMLQSKIRIMHLSI